MEKIFCDRCGKEIDLTSNAMEFLSDGPFFKITAVTYGAGINKIKTNVDLCHKCQKEVFSWYET